MSQKLAVRMSDDTYRALKERAQQANTSMNALIVGAIEDLLRADASVALSDEGQE